MTAPVPAISGIWWVEQYVAVLSGRKDADVAVMHVEIDDRRARDAVALLRITRRDRGVVENAEAHGPCGFGMMTGRPRGDESVGGLFAHHLVDRMHGAAGGTQSRIERTRRHRGVGVGIHDAEHRRRFADLRDVLHRMTERDDVERRFRRLHACERLKFLDLERVLDRARQPLGPLWMAERRGGGAGRDSPDE